MALDVERAEFRNLHPFLQLVEIMEALRAPDGCPWDRAQTHRTLTRYLLEESYETLEAIEQDNSPELCVELGDLLLQIVFHAQVAREAGRFVIDDVCRAIVDKMIRRHPHVFSSAPKLADGAQVYQQWEDIKQREKSDPGQKRKSRLQGLPTALPSLALAERMQERAAQVNFDFPDAEQAWEKLREELGELERDPSAAELGDVLFACVSLARKLSIDPEAALRATCEKFRQRFQGVEAHFGDSLSLQEPAALIEAWNLQKKNTNGGLAT